MGVLLDNIAIVYLQYALDNHITAISKILLKGNSNIHM